MSQPQTEAQDPTPNPDISSFERVSFLFGWGIAHSLSPLLHNTVYSALKINYQYILYESKDLEQCLQIARTEPKFYGAAVTMPHKVAVIPHLDVLTPEGEAIGAINTIFLRNSPQGKRLLCGTNTDCIGIREAILQNVSKEEAKNIEGKPGMIIGGGGTCRAAVYALKHFLGCSEIYLVNRDKSECDAVIAECTSKGFGEGLKYISSVEEAQNLVGPSVIISAIPDFEPKSDSEITARRIVETMLDKRKGEKKPMLEMCYHPSPDTAIAALGTSYGWNVIPGVEAMIWQGLEQDKIWLRRKVSTLPVDEVKGVIATATSKPHL